MSCTRAAEVDLAAFRADPGAAEFGDFARHYPACPECARAVAEWSALEAVLRDAGGGEGHPGEEQLLAYQDAPQSLDAAQRRAIDAHLSGCARCRSELAVLRSFDLAALAPAATVATGEGGLAARLRDGLTRLAETVFGVPQPALALALVLLLLAPAVFFSWRLVTGDAGRESPPVARRTPPAPEPVPPVPVEPAPEMPRVEIAREPAEPEPAPAPPEPEAPEQVAVEPSPAPPEPEVVPEPAPSQPEPAPAPEPFRIAALLPAELPAYAAGAAPVGSLDPVRVDSVVRAAGDDLPTIRALGPEHVGATHQASPTLYWSLGGPSDVPVELTLLAEDAVEPLLELRIDAPRAGTHALRLGERGVTLEPERTYLWFASLVPDDARRDRDVVSGAAVRRVPDPELERRLDEAPPERRAHLLASAGYWYDAFALVEEWLEAEPDAPRLAAYREALLRQAGLGEGGTLPE